MVKSFDDCNLIEAFKYYPDQSLELVGGLLIEVKDFVTTLKEG